jgi:hypothetical protein
MGSCVRRDEYDLSFSRQHLARGLQIHAPQIEGARDPRREGAGKTGCALHHAISCAIVHQGDAHEHTGSAEAVRPSLRNGFTVSFVLSPVIGPGCHRRKRDAKHHRQLDASLEASGPHDFAVRAGIARLAPHCVHCIPPRVS